MATHDIIHTVTPAAAAPSNAPPGRLDPAKLSPITCQHALKHAQTLALLH